MLDGLERWAEAYQTSIKESVARLRLIVRRLRQSMTRKKSTRRAPALGVEKVGCK